MMLQTIIFSKNRPAQLSYYLESLQFVDYFRDLGPISVLWTADNEKDEYDYERLIKMGSVSEPPIKFVKQTDFYQDLNLLIGEAPYTLFGVDDGLFFNHIDVKRCLAFMTKNDVIFGHSLRLHPNVTYCHPAGQHNVVPHIQTCYKYPGLGFYDATLGRYDWCYAFELCATILRTPFVVDVLESYRDKITSPNSFEACGHTQWMSDLNSNPDDYRYSGCMLYDAFCVPTINRVQDEYQNPVYEGKINMSDLNMLAIPDYQWYRTQNFDRIHVAELKLVQ